jgi:hypothetical protein
MAKLNQKLESPILITIDFRFPADQKRLWIIDAIKGTLLLISVLTNDRN